MVVRPVRLLHRALVGRTVRAGAELLDRVQGRSPPAVPQQVRRVGRPVPGHHGELRAPRRRGRDPRVQHDQHQDQELDRSGAAGGPGSSRARPGRRHLARPDQRDRRRSDVGGNHLPQGGGRPRHLPGPGHDLHHASVRMEDGHRRFGGTGARPHHHGGDLRARRQGGDAGDRDRHPDHPGIFVVRRRGDLRQDQGEHRVGRRRRP